MFAIDAPGNAAGKFTEGDPTSGVRPTKVSADWLNAIQSELLAVLAEAEIAPAKADSAQVIAALRQVLMPRTGGAFSGDIGVVRPGSSSLILNSAGTVRMKLSAQADGSVALYRSTGGPEILMLGTAGAYLDTAYPIRHAGLQVFDAGNDGAGSGLDADTVRGFVPADRDGQIFGGAVAATGLVAYAGDLSLNRGDQDYGFITRPNVAGKKKVGIATESGGQLEIIDLNTVFLRRSGSVVWDAGTDGAGSGLDADVFHGHVIEEFPLNTDFPAAKAGNGWYALPNGMIEQWGQAAHGNASGVQPINFPRAFPNACLNVVVSNATGAGPPTAFHGAGNFSPAGATIYSAVSSGSPAGSGTSFFWRAVGY